MNSQKRQWAVGQLLTYGYAHGTKTMRLLVLGRDDEIYSGCLVAVNQDGRVLTISVTVCQTCTSFTITATSLAYTYTSRDQAKADADTGLFNLYFPTKPDAVAVPGDTI